jgi:hypothetical protein
MCGRASSPVTAECCGAHSADGSTVAVAAAFPGHFDIYVFSVVGRGTKYSRRGAESER